MIIWLTGNSGAGKTTTAQTYKRINQNSDCVILDGDEMRDSISLGAGFNKEDREEHNLRVARLAKVMEKQHDIVLITVIAPFQETRIKIQELIPEVKWIYIKRSLLKNKEE